MKLKKFIFSILLFVVAFAAVAIQKNKSMAVTIGSQVYLQRANKGYYTLQAKTTSGDWMYVTYSITHYMDTDGTRRIAYCVEPDRKGIGWINGEYEGYNVDIVDELKNARMYRVYTNGYPYKTKEALGVETEEDAYLATKMASYAILRGYSTSDVRAHYRPGEDPVEGENLADIQRRGRKVLDAICLLVSIADNIHYDYGHSNLQSVEKYSGLKVDDVNSNYCSVVFKVNFKNVASTYMATNLKGFPEGSFYANMSGKAQTRFNNDKYFKVMIPKDKVKQDIKGSVSVYDEYLEYPIYYGKCTIGNYQNYMLCSKEKTNRVTVSADVLEKPNNSTFILTKIDKDTKKPIEGVKFSFKYADGTNIGIYKTDKNGMITLKNLYPKKIVVKEVEAAKYYTLDETTRNITLEYAKESALKLQNEKKKAAIKIIKVDAENNLIKLKDVLFQISDENDNIIKKVKTDENGEIIIKNLPINLKYKIKELSTNKEYILYEKVVTIQLEENEIKTLTFKNKKIKKEIPKEEIKKLPRTGEVDYISNAIAMLAIGTTVNILKIKKYI